MTFYAVISNVNYEIRQVMETSENPFVDVSIYGDNVFLKEMTEITDEPLSVYYSMGGDVFLPKTSLPISVDTLTIPADSLVIITVPTVCPNNLPITVSAQVFGETIETDDGIFELSFPDVGTYKIELTGRNYLPATVEIEVT